MDPLSVLITTAVLWHLLRVVVEDLAAGAADDAHRRRLAQLADAGYLPPAHGGSGRRWWATAWRVAWADAVRRYQARADAHAAGEQADAAAWQRWRARMAQRGAEVAGRITDRWRQTPPADSAAPRPRPAPHPAETDVEAPADVVVAVETPTSAPIRVSATVGARTETAGPHGSFTPVATLVAATVGAAGSALALAATRVPHTTTPETDVAEGNGSMSNAVVAASAVTGVVSGAAAARAIARQVEDANAAYVAALARVRANIAALGEQTVAVVQMAGHSQVVERLMSAAESAAVAQRAATQLGAEVGPWLVEVARAYDRLNS